MIKRILGTSLVFRLWITLSLLAAVFATAALATYVLLSVNDNVEAAHKATVDKGEVVVAAVTRLGQDGVVNNPSITNNNIGRSLGLRSIQFISKKGSVLGNSPAYGELTSREPEPGKADTTAALGGKRVQRRVELVGDSYFRNAASPPEVIQGGTFGEEFIYPLDVPEAPGVGAMRFVIEYPNLTAEAHTLIVRVAWVGLVIISATLIGMWVFLRVFVSRPLRRYSQLAIRIAGGEPIRMPASGNDELGELGRAMNGMADALEHQATVDKLTGLYNLRHLSSNLEALIADAKLGQSPLSLIVGDLDNLKPVNDTYGHSVGDKLLQAVSDTLRSWSGARFTCWRLGGDEFVVAMPQVGEQEAIDHAHNLRGKIGSILLASGSSQVRASISVGVATYPTDGESAGSLLNAADRRMYALKALRAEERRLAAAQLAA